MSKKKSIRTHKFLISDARRLSPEAIEEIRNARHIMCKKHRIGSIQHVKK